MKAVACPSAAIIGVVLALHAVQLLLSSNCLGVKYRVGIVVAAQDVMRSDGSDGV